MPKRQKRRLITDLIRTANGKSPRGTFNHAVMETAEDINKCGLRRQLQFLLNQLGAVQATKLVEDLVELEQAVNDLTAQAMQDGRLGVLLRVIYDLKMKEAHQVAHSKPRNTVRYLVRKLGVDRVNKLINGI